MPDPRHHFRFRLESGDFLIYDNHRMLHARTSFEGPRWVRGVYFDNEGHVIRYTATSSTPGETRSRTLVVGPTTHRIVAVGD